MSITTMRLARRAGAFAICFAFCHLAHAEAPALDGDDVKRAVGQFKPVLEKTIHDTGVPGVAVGVVFNDQLVWSAGYGVREVGKPEPIDDHSLFQLASVSKPISATVIARMVGERRLRWEDPVVTYMPGFGLADRWISRRVTIADMYSHRGGLPDHAGDDLEEIGYTREQIFARLRMHRMNDFRADYAYTNYGLTAAAEAAANAIDMTWADASRELLYKPAGMTSTTSRFDEYMASSNRAVPHVRLPDGTWVAKFQQQPDETSPAAGVASNVVDLARWMRLQLNAGVLDGRQIVDTAALAKTHVPYALSQDVPSYTARPNHYGLGWYVDVDELGQVRWWHSGAFALGASTIVHLVPSQKLGIVILTNGFPVGLPEAMAQVFLDMAFHGEPRQDWFAAYNAAFEAALYPKADPDYSKPPPNAAPPSSALSAYTGTYHNGYYGQLTVFLGADGQLAMAMGPAQRVFRLGHYSGDTFWYTPPGEFGVAPSAAKFAFGQGQVSLVIEGFSRDYLQNNHGPFLRRY